VKRVGGDVVENISNFLDQAENIVLVVKEGLELGSD
jgi:hypothetical protein